MALWKSMTIAALLAVSLPSPVWAQDVALAGVLGRDKALLVVGGGQPKVVRVGGQIGGLRLISVSGNEAVVEQEGRRETLVLGQTPVRMAERIDVAVVLTADAQGHHFTRGTINGANQQFIVDSGASLVSLGRGDAERIGLDYRSGQPATVQAASGPATVWKVRLDQVTIGSLTVHGVDAVVFENDLPFALLGMSYLNRVRMQRDGNRITLRRR